MALTSKNNLPRIQSQLERALSAIVRKSAFRIEAKWKADVRVDTGQYRNSVQTRIDGPMKATIGSNVEHAIYNELGTRHMAGRPSATTSADTEAKKFEQEVRNLERQLR